MWMIWSWFSAWFCFHSTHSRPVEIFLQGVGAMWCCLMLLGRRRQDFVSWQDCGPSLSGATWHDFIVSQSDAPDHLNLLKDYLPQNKSRKNHLEDGNMIFSMLYLGCVPVGQPAIQVSKLSVICRNARFAGCAFPRECKRLYLCIDICCSVISSSLHATIHHHQNPG